ncbi:APC family permease [Henriciella aquimarina]|uniref:APC family permease n=1 Tax=Henriciella aquimarina TaxID=545261 RepID=UPI000A0571B8|nr:APC family permease [Henriciella aquimarina]
MARLPETASDLKRTVGVTGVVALGLGTAIGVSVFSILAPAAALAGPAMLVSMLFAMVPMIVFGVVYAFMGAAVPVTGASFEWPRRFVHPFLGFLISWLRIAGSTAAVIVLTMVLVSYLGTAIDVPLKPTMLAILVFVLAVNLIGVSAATISQSIMLFILLATCAVFAFGSVPSISMERFEPFASHGTAGVLAAIPLMISLFLGIESATEVGGEVTRPGRTIPLGITISVLLTAAVYFIVAFAAIGVLGGEGLAASEAPLLDAAIVSLGEPGRWLILISATVAIGSSINATFIIMSRFLYAMARAGMLPGALARVHENSGVPRPAVLVAFLLCCLGLFMPDNLVFLFLAVNIPTILKYAATCLSSIMLLKRQPDLHAASAFRPSRHVLQGFAVAGILLGGLIIVLGWSADWRPYLLLAGWALLGVLYYGFARRFGQPALSEQGAAGETKAGTE